MFNLFLGQLLILILAIICTGRVFFTKDIRIDSAAFLSPLIFLLALLEIFVLELTPILCLIFVLSCLILITNGHSLVRLSNRLFVDHYNLPFVVFTIIEFVFAVLLLIALLIFVPVNYSLKDNNVKSQKILLSGTLAKGFQESSLVEEKLKFDGILREYTPLEDSKMDKNTVVLFVGTAKAPVLMYEPYLILLSKLGYRVVGADFYSKDAGIFNSYADSPSMRRIFALGNMFLEPKEFEKYEKIQMDLLPREYSALADFVLKKYGKESNIFFVTDGIDYDSILNVLDKFSENGKGFFSLNRIDEYKTSGFGFVEQNDLILAKYFKIQRDSSLFIPRYAAGKTAAEIKAITRL